MHPLSSPLSSPAQDSLITATVVRERARLAAFIRRRVPDAGEAEDILQAGDADLVAVARVMLYRPRWPWEAAAALGGQVQASAQYWRCLPRNIQGVFGAIHIGQR